MTPSSAHASPDGNGTPETSGRWTPRLAGVLLALTWPTQLVTAVVILGSNSLASVAQVFHTTQVVWFTLVVTLVYTLFTPFLFKLGDLYGRKRIMVAVTGLGVVGDSVAAMAGHYWLVLVGRALGAGYGVFPALAYPAIRDIFPAKLVKSASGLLASAGGLVALASPFLAAWLVDGWGYRGGLWFLASVSAVAFVLVVFLVPETPRHAFDSGFDWLGGLTLGGGLSALVYVLGRGDEWGWGSGETLSWITGGALALVAFVLVERSASYPILNLKVLRRRSVATVLLSASWGQAVAFSAPTISILLALYPHIPGVSDGLGWSVHHNAVITAPASVIVFLIGVYSSRLMRRVDARLLARCGLALMALGFLLMGSFHADETQLMWTMCVANLGGGTVVAAAPVMVVGAVTPDEHGQASGTLIMLLGLFSALFGALFFAVLDAHSTVMKGTAFYSDSGYTAALRLGGLLGLVALAIALFIPPLREPERDAAALPVPAAH
ncbi:MFS transporter [Streptomyces sp. NPDC051576]|uniref:MFS transporter n=1 Tax=Streptomyces sp. NPDC051576 TaxID=3155803 RepID=UPI0034408C33